jgi:hypothetical protein
MYYAGRETTQVKPISTARKTEVRKAKYRKTQYAHLSRKSRKPMNRTGAPQLGIALPWNFLFQPGESSVTPIAQVSRESYTPSSWSSRSVFGYSKRSSRKPGTGRSRGGLGTSDNDESLGLSFNIPALTTSYTPPESFSPTSAAPVTPASGADSFWNPLATIVEAWNNRPQVLKDIRIRVNPTKAAQFGAGILPPKAVGQAIDYARNMGFDPTYLTKYGEVPITGTMAQYAYQARATDWSAYLPWILGAGAAVIVLPMVLGKR